MTVNGALCLGSGELVYEQRLKTICNKMRMVRKICFKRVEYNDPHK